MLITVNLAAVTLFLENCMLWSFVCNTWKCCCLQGGHHVTMLIHANYTPSPANMDITSQLTLLQFTPPTQTKTMCHFQSLQHFLDLPIHDVIGTFYSSTMTFCQAILSDDKVMHQVKAAGFDLAIYDVVDPCSRILADYIDIPFITFHSTGLDTVMPRNPAYMPTLMTSFSDDMTLWQRILNTLGYVIQRLIKYKTMHYISQLKTRFNINTSISVEHSYDRESLKLVLGDYGLDYVGPIQPSTILVGGFIHPQTTVIPRQIIDILEDSEQQGVVLFSFGTFVRNYDPYWRELFAKALAQLPYTVIWKYDGVTPDNLGNNTHLVSWLPQYELLSDSRVRAFITHSGINSAYESAYHGVPVIAIPLFGEQSFQATKIVRAGLAIRLDIRSLTESSLRNAILDVACEQHYHQNAKQVSKIMKSKAQPQHKEILYWVNYVLKLGGTRHLQSQESKLAWYQLMLIDVGLIYITMLLLIMLSMKCTFKWLFSFYWRNDLHSINSKLHVH